MDRLLDKIELLEQENARLKARVAELEKTFETRGSCAEAECKFNEE